MADRDDRPFREVLADRKRSTNAQDKELRERAFRERAWIQVTIMICLCTWPLEKHPTETEHALWCPSHRTIVKGKPQ